MRHSTAHAVRAKTPICVLIDWSKADDHALVGGLLADDACAWLEFLGRFDELLTKRIEATLGQWSRRLRSTDLIEEIKGEIHAHLIGRRMMPLRAFDPRHGTLAAWLSRVAHQSAMRRLQTLTTLDEGDDELLTAEDV